MHVTILQEDYGRYAIVGLFYFRQLFFIKFDLKLHADKSQIRTCDRTEAADYIKLLMIYTSGSPLDKALLDTLPVIIYTYSLVLAADMYMTVIKKNPLDAALEKFYKDKVLLVDGSQEETDLRVSPVAGAIEQDFLGRLPDSDVFLKKMFRQTPAANL
ncbi:hypothetical protein M405DRAFT_885579 [Rhizopogon salebrosus TDB-379]|nr:hypothetical protein M405DRAFT_885579 [Rhizopogon salebrosus TDB-379]